MTLWLLLASWTPPAARHWRRLLLRCFGAQMGRNSDVRGGARVWYPPNLVMEDDTLLAGRVNCYNMARITLRRGAIVSQGAYLCGGTHDFRDPHFTLIPREIEIGALAWVASEAFIGPGTMVPDGCVVGARAVVFGRLVPWGIYSGNPAVLTGMRHMTPRP